MSKLNVLVCGGGNGAHTIAGLASSREDVEVRWMSLFRDEAERIAASMAAGDGMLEVVQPGGVVSKSKPELITKDASVAVPGANLIIFCMPAFAHAEYFETIAKYLEPNAVVCGMPGQFGFQFQASALMGENGATCSVLCFETMPWACRILEFGKKVEVLGTKDKISSSFNPGLRDPNAPNAVSLMQRLLGPAPVVALCDNYLEVNLFTVVHPPILWGQWKDWDQKPVAEKPLFYQGLNKEAADMLDRCSKELLETAAVIQTRAPHLNMSGVIHILDWYKKAYPEDIDDWSSLQAAMQCCKSYRGLTHAMKEVEGGFVPDWTYRYLSEDLPFGFCVNKGIAELCGVDTPALDEVIKWGQEKMGKEFIVGTSLSGKDVGSTRAPQNYGIKSFEDLVKLAGPAAGS